MQVCWKNWFWGGCIAKGSVRVYLAWPLCVTQISSLTVSACCPKNYLLYCFAYFPSFPLFFSFIQKHTDIHSLKSLITHISLFFYISPVFHFDLFFLLWNWERGVGRIKQMGSDGGRNRRSRGVRNINLTKAGYIFVCCLGGWMDGWSWWPRSLTDLGTPLEIVKIRSEKHQGSGGDGFSDGREDVLAGLGWIGPDRGGGADLCLIGNWVLGNLVVADCCILLRWKDNCFHLLWSSVCLSLNFSSPLFLRLPHSIGLVEVCV